MPGCWYERLVPAAIISLVMVVTLPLSTGCGLGELTAAVTPSPTDVHPSPTSTTAPTATPTPSLEDPHEPNDSMIQASGPLVAGQEYQGYVSEKDDIDFFYLEIDAPQTVTVTLTDMPSGVDYDLYLVTREEDILSSSSNSGPEEEHVEYTTSSVGVFYVLVLPFENFSREEPYTLQFDMSPAPSPSGEDNFEPNDTFQQATGPLTYGQTYHSYIWDEGDTDTYLFVVESGGTIALHLSDIPAIADYDLFLYNQAGDLLVSSNRVVDHERIEQYLGPGTYYSAVRSFAGFSRNEPYALQVAVVEP